MSRAKVVKKQEETLRELERLARKVGLRVAYGDMKFAGLKLRSGHCLFKGERWLVLDRKQSFEDKLELFSDALGEFDLTGEELPPELFTEERAALYDPYARIERTFVNRRVREALPPLMGP